MDAGAELPQLLADFAAAAGLAAALRLAADFGGTEIYVPRQAPPGHRLAESLGAEAAAKLCALYGGGQVLIPLGPAADQRKTIAHIHRLFDKRLSAPRIARQVGRHVRTIFYHKRKHRDGDDGGQGTLI